MPQKTGIQGADRGEPSIRRDERTFSPAAAAKITHAVAFTHWTPIGLDYLGAYCVFGGSYWFDDSIWRLHEHSYETRKRKEKEAKNQPLSKMCYRWQLRACDLPQARGVQLFGSRPLRTAGCTVFRLCCNPNRIKLEGRPGWTLADGLRNPAGPEDAAEIFAFLDRFITKYAPAEAVPPLTSELWQVSGVDFNFDFQAPFEVANALVRGFSGLGFQRSKRSSVYHFCERLEPEEEFLADDEMFAPSKWELGTTGLLQRNQGKRLRYAHVLYDKFEESFNPYHPDPKTLDLPPDLRREEMRFRGKAILRAIGIEDRSIPGVLEFSDRTRAFKTILKKQGVDSLPAPLGDPLDACFPNRPTVRARYLEQDAAGRTAVDLILAGHFDRAQTVMKESGHSPPDLRTMKNYRGKWHAAGLYLAEPTANAIFHGFLAGILLSPDGCFLPTPGLATVMDPQPESAEPSLPYLASPQRRALAPALEQPDPDGEKMDGANASQPCRRRMEGRHPPAQQRTAGSGFAVTAPQHPGRPP